MNPLHPDYVSDLSRTLERLPEIEQLRNCKVIITGATGMIGSCLTDLLGMASDKLGLNITLYTLCRFAPRAADRFEHLKCVKPTSWDLTGSLKWIPEADYIIHAASNAHPLAFSTDPVGTMMGNILGTRNLLEHLRDSHGKRLMFLSTGEIYGENPAVTDGFDEQAFGKVDSMNPRSCYPESKRAAETLCASYVRQFDVDAVVARPCYIYGPTITDKSTRADAQFLRKALAGEDIVMKSAGSQLRSYCYVTDAAAALLTILLRGEAGNAYNIASRACIHTIREYAETLAKLAGVNVVFDLPPEAERAGYSTVSRAVQNPAKLEGLGWKAEHTLESGMRQMLRVLDREVHDESEIH